MRYKLLSFAAVLLLATPVSAQETSPIVIETFHATPSVVRSGELFQVTYRAKFYDSVLIVEEQMQPENIVSDPFETVKLQIISLPDYGDEDTGIIHVQDFIYTFRIIKPEKGDKEIPSFKFIWVVKKAGTTEDNAKQANELKEIPTEPVGVRYAHSPVKPPGLNIRDETNLPPFKWSGENLRNASYAVMATSTVLVLFVFVALVKSKKTKGKRAQENKSAEVVEEGVAPEIVTHVLPKNARKKLIRELNKLLKGTNKSPLDLEKEVFALLREFILVELAEAPVKALASDSPSEIYGRLIKLTDVQKQVVRRYEASVYLAERLRGYYSDIELGRVDNFDDPRAEMVELINRVKGVGFWKSFLVSMGLSNAR